MLRRSTPCVVVPRCYHIYIHINGHPRCQRPARRSQSGCAPASPCFDRWHPLRRCGIFSPAHTHTYAHKKIKPHIHTHTHTTHTRHTRHTHTDVRTRAVTARTRHYDTVILLFQNATRRACTIIMWRSLDSGGGAMAQWLGTSSSGLPRWCGTGALLSSAQSDLQSRQGVRTYTTDSVIYE